MKRENLSAHFAVLGANVIFGLNYVIAKGIMPVWMAPRAIIFLRVTGAAAAFWLTTIWVKKEKVARADLKRMFVAAFFGVALNQILFFEGLNLTTPINASIIMVGTPILVLVMSHFIIKESVSGMKMAGILLGFSGAAFLILRNGQFSLRSDTTLGNLLVLINAASYGLFLVLVKPLMSRYRPLTVMRIVFSFGLIFVIPVTIGPFLHTDFRVIPLNIWLSIIYVVIFTTILAYLLNNYSLKKISPSANSSYIYLQPVMASLVAIAAGKDRLTLTEVLASLLIFAGVYFVNAGRRKKHLA
ncbi:DMT family transporter [Candidatus Sulfidibacterium hydrothermale]|jgi:drug/metabolite transporter (DMT)-like permease|uniref:DMT family transporter n=1 Tax=Candidatus Sulfidibacterium hydrothermale TaxID=2875962 RepID=UPI001F0A4C01|nr:DMT family transporter [Candidatus Sulfidibacterium hydrothermale]UBM63084.1 DMT family transporter [Candidatus Sulfidibacterium hydrothermale]